MGSDKTTRSKLLAIHNRQGKSPDQIPGLMASGMALLLTALLIVGIWVSPAVADLPTDCIKCHGTFDTVHGSITHNATPPSSKVVLFADNDHDSSGWSGTPPYFATLVDCGTCHNNYLPAIHSNDCATCHPSPYNTIGNWGGGCQQGGCHTVFHGDSITAHKPFANSYDYANNDCTRCHEASSGLVLQTNCLNCHAAPGNGYVNPPITTSNAQSFYDGAAEIDFSIKAGGKVGIGRTFYRLDGGPTTSGSKVVVTTPGAHDLEFWSVDQFGIIESSTNMAYFTITDDSTPPTTTSNAQSTYYQGALITLTATDESTQGVKNTYYSLNGGFTQTGTSVTIPATPGVISYTLVFWSVDWSGNIETQNSVTFTVTSGNGTIRLVWWDCDVDPSHVPTGTDKANWTIRSGSSSGPVVASGSGASPNWSGINDIPVPVTPTPPYFVRVNWWNSEGGYYEITEFPNVYVTTPGQIVKFNY